MIVASIDIGTNTVLLLIAEVDVATRQIYSLLNEQRIPRIGMGLQPGSKIGKDKIEELLNILAYYNNLIKVFKCEKIILVGTHALRIAKNSSEIINLIQRKFGFKVRVISGLKEAELAYLGALSGVQNSGRSFTVIDIGGGSTEIIYGKGGKILFNKSFKTGSVSATEKYLLHSPPLQIELNNLQDELRSIFSEINQKFHPDKTIGIAGTITTLACMIKGIKSFDGLIVENSTISLSEVTEITAKIEKLHPSKMLLKYGEVLKGREDVITAGSIILRELMILLTIQNLTVSSRGIRYGAIFAELFSQD